MLKDLKKSDGIDCLVVLNNPLLPTAYLAPISYYAILLQDPNCRIELHEHFIKQSIRNRCDIYGANGKLRLSIPKQRKGSSKTIIKNLKISYKQNWQKQHWNAIESAYNSSPFFEYYEDDLAPLFHAKQNHLLDFNFKCLEIIFECLQLDFNYQTTSCFEAKPKNCSDYRYLANARKEKEHLFKPYTQVFSNKHGYINNLSILDLLFNEGTNTVSYLQSQKIYL